MHILVITDTLEYGPEATLYPLLHGLCRNENVAGVYVADRIIGGCDDFFYDLDPSVTHVKVRKADTDYRYETQDNYAVESFPLAQADAIWMRLDLAGEDFLKYVQAQCADAFISNNPAGMIETGSKEFLLKLRDDLGAYMPHVTLVETAAEVMAFREQCPHMVLKVLRSYGGKGVVRFRAHGNSELNNREDVHDFLAENGPCLAMEYLENENQSDNRLVVLDGEILGVIRRLPQPGGWLCNLMAGGSFEVGDPDAREIEIVRRITPLMRAHGIHYYGVDTLLNANNERVLSELNTINSGGAYRYELKTGKPVCRRIADSFVDQLRAYKGA